jgi:transcriptional regulator
MLLDASSPPLGSLRAHVSRANPQHKNFSPDVQALAIFGGPHAYISPSWYASKKEDGKVVPTWNYAVVHAYGFLKLFDDPQRLHAHVGALTKLHEAGFAEPWKVEDAPAEYIERHLKGIVGLEMQIDRLEGKWKISQNRPETDRAGVVSGLTARGDTAMANLMKPDE